MNFKDRVCRIVRQIPQGSAMSYKEVAKVAGRPRAYRAVGNILHNNYNKNIPCHRVIRSDGRIGGFRDGEAAKITLLKKEKYL